MASLLVLWDVDHTLINAGGVGIQVYEQAFRELYSLEVPSVRIDMAGRTDRAIAIEMLTVAGLPDPHGRVVRVPGRPGRLRARAGRRVRGARAGCCPASAR